MDLLFDLDGTLTDPGQGIVACLRHALVSLGHAPPAEAELQRFIGPPLRDCFGALLGCDDDGPITAAVDAYRARFTEIGMFENLVYHGIPEALAALQSRGARLFVATSKAQVFAERILRHFGLADRFTAIHGSELDGTRSDKRQLIAHVLASEGLRAQDTVMIGDRRHDMIGAIGNGVLPIGVLWGYGSASELTTAGASRLLADPEALTELAAGAHA